MAASTLPSGARAAAVKAPSASTASSPATTAPPVARTSSRSPARKLTAGGRGCREETSISRGIVPADEVSGYYSMKGSQVWLHVLVRAPVRGVGRGSHKHGAALEIGSVRRGAYRCAGLRIKARAEGGIGRVDVGPPADRLAVPRNGARQLVAHDRVLVGCCANDRAPVEGCQDLLVHRPAVP